MDIILPTIVFLIVILVLILVLLVANTKLESTREVNLVINGKEENPLKILTGISLLSALSTNKIFLPSACGGKGTCGLCKVVVEKGAGEISPTEEGHLSRKENIRLACQVKVKNNLWVMIPQEIIGIKKMQGEVVSNNNVATFIKELVIKLPDDVELDFQPGAYIQIDAPPFEVNFGDLDISPCHSKGENNTYTRKDQFEKDWLKYKLRRLYLSSRESVSRAYSLASYPKEGKILKLNVRIATPPWDSKTDSWNNVSSGTCSSYLFSRRPGDKISFSGPYGHFKINPTNREMIYIGGGAGMAPLRSQILHLFDTEKTDRNVSYWYGGRSMQELFYVDEFRAIAQQYPNFEFQLALSEPEKEDHWSGKVGFIHQVLFDSYLGSHPEPEEIEFYICGPPMMLKASLKMLDELGVPDENIRYDDFGS